MYGYVVTYDVQREWKVVVGKREWWTDIKWLKYKLKWITVKVSVVNKAE